VLAATVRGQGTTENPVVGKMQQTGVEQAEHAWLKIRAGLRSDQRPAPWCRTTV